MADDGIWDDLVKAGLIIGSIWLGAEFLKKLTKRCWKCQSPMASDQRRCLICGQDGQ